jgi:peptidoglycan/LPS O-acetylase OafA/YrhL
MRALAAVSIVIVHVWSTSMPHGQVLWTGGHLADGLSTLSAGVTLFFTLSGFLLYRPFAAAIARGQQRLPIRAYLRNRALRIVPAYWVILAFTALVLASVNVRDGSGVLGTGRISDPAQLFQSALLLQDYTPRTDVIGIGPAWSLAVELVFYLVLPLLTLAALALARRAFDRRGRVLALLLPPAFLLVLGLSGKAAAAWLVPGAGPLAGYGTNWHSVVERSFWTQADLFSFGMLVAVLHTEVSDRRLALPAGWRRFAVGAALPLFAACAWTMHRGEHSYLVQNTGEALAIALAFSAIVLPEHRERRPLLAVRVLESRTLTAIGLASYSLFLWHYPVIAWLRGHGLTTGGGAAALGLNFVVVALVAGGLSALTYRFVELPALRRKRSTRPSATVQPDAPVPTEAPVAATGSPAMQPLTP